MIAKQIPYRYPNIKFMNDRLRPKPDLEQAEQIVEDVT